MSAELEKAALDLAHPLAAQREQAEVTLIRAKEAAIPALCHALTAPLSPGQKRPVGRSALLLGALRARESLDALYEAALLEDTTEDDRVFIARALAEILDGRDAFDDRARDVLEIFAKSKDKFARAFSAKSFAALGDVRSVARIEALARDDDAWVKEQAQTLLTELALNNAPDVSVDDFAALVKDANQQGGTLRPLLNDLADERAAVRERAVVEIIRHGKKAVPHLIEMLNQPLIDGRIGAARALSRLQSPDAVGPLIIAASTPAKTAKERELVPVALRSLANSLTGTEVGLADTLLPLSQSDDRFIRAAALLCLGRIAERRGIQSVIAALFDDDLFVVESASIALSEGVREDDLELVKPLLFAFDQVDGTTSFALREAILIALSRIQIEDPALKVRVKHRVRREVLGPTAAVRKAAIALLDRLHDADSPPVLPLTDAVLTRLSDSHPEVRVVAACFLANHLVPGFTHAEKNLERCIKEGERTSSLLCLDALIRHDSLQAREVLARATNHRDSEVAMAAAEHMSTFEPKTLPWRFETKIPNDSDDELAQSNPKKPRGGGEVVEARFDDS